jgi:peptidyl-prolyl cis-trans isomerase D
MYGQTGRFYTQNPGKAHRYCDNGGFPQFVHIPFYPIFAVQILIRQNMQIIQSIRDKGAAIVIGVIALSLIGFLLMDANTGQGKLFGSSRSTTVGKVNGSSISENEFNDKMAAIEMETGQKAGGGPEGFRLRQQAFDVIVAEKIFLDEAQKAGIVFSPAEMMANLYSPEDAPEMLKRSFSDQQTGVYDVNKVREWWKNVRKKNADPRVRQEADMIIDKMKIGSLYKKYNSMMTAAAYYPTWLQEKENADNNQFATISYASIPYNVIADSTIKVSDEEVSTYIAKRKSMFKQDAGRMISYVAFSADPSKADTLAAQADLAKLKADFLKDSNAVAFAARNSTTLPFDDKFVLKSKMMMPFKDSIAALSKNQVFGPYLDASNFVMAKMVETRTVPDSVKCRHILIKIADAQAGQVRPDSVARKLVDSIKAAIAGGADFNEMVLKYSDDPGSKMKKGEYDFGSTSQLVDSFYRTVFYEPVGTKKIVKGESGGQQGYIGYHYIEVLKQWKMEPAFKVAYLGKEILASEETISTASVKATRLCGAARTAKQLDEYVAKNGLSKISNPAIVKENDYMVGNLQNARDLVRWAFEAKEGQVSPEAFSIDNQYVVGVVEKVQEEGTADAKTARPQVEQEIRNRKKAAEIMKKLPAGTTVEAAAAAYGKTVQMAGADSSITFAAMMVPGIGNEPKLVGAAFNKEWQAKPSAAIPGSFGVYVIKVNGYGTKPAATPETVEQQRKMREQSLRQQASAWFNSLREQATIKDKHNR